MANRRKVNGLPRGEREPAATLIKQDEADILDEVEAESDGSGGFVASEEKIKEIGAVDAESVRANRQREEVVRKKLGNVPNVSFNTGDVLTTYDTILKLHAANMVEIHIKRLTGFPVQNVITTCPRSGVELFEAIKKVHGQHEEAEYEVNFVDKSRKTWLGKGARIGMPDTREQGQPMNPYYPPPQGYPPPGYPPQQPQQAAPPGAAPQPIVMQAPAGPDMNTMLSIFQQMFEMSRSMQPPQAVPAPQWPAPPQQQPLPPPPPAGADVNTQMAWMRQAFEMFQSMRGQQQQPAPAPAPTPNPMAAMGFAPPIEPPRGMMWIPNFGFVPLERLVEAINPRQPPGPGPGYRSAPYRPPYGREDAPPHQPQYTPPPREKTPGEVLRDSMTTMRSTMEAVEELRTMLPGAYGSPPETTQEEDDDSPIRIVDTGKGKLAYSKTDNSLRAWDSVIINAPDILKWGGEQMEKIQKAASERQQQQRPPQQQLPPGYIEVEQGYQPPPGYVPVDHLPPAPVHVPPPIQSGGAWAPPTIPEEEEER